MTLLLVFFSYMFVMSTNHSVNDAMGSYRKFAATACHKQLDIWVYLKQSAFYSNWNINGRSCQMQINDFGFNAGEDIWDVRMYVQFWMRNHLWKMKLFKAIDAQTPRQQGSRDQQGTHLGPGGPRWDPCWPHEPCYQGKSGIIIRI